jgi:hypothetical protein
MAKSTVSTKHETLAQAVAAAIPASVETVRTVVALPDYQALGIHVTSRPTFVNSKGRSRGDGRVAFQREFEALIAAWRQNNTGAWFPITGNPAGEPVGTAAKRGYVVAANKALAQQLASIGVTIASTVAPCDGFDDNIAWRKGDAIVFLKAKRSVTY